MSQEKLEKKPITYDVKEEAKKTPATEGGIATDDKEKGVVAESTGVQVPIYNNPIILYVVI